MINTEFDFMLPKGLLDNDGVVHRQGRMRLATAKDEITVQRDRRAQESDAYGTLVLLSRVITHLGTISIVTPELLENLFTQDLGYLREVYNQVNQQGHLDIAIQCPACQHQFVREFALSGEF